MYRGNSAGFSGSGYTQQGLMLITPAEAGREILDSPGLISGRFERGNKFKIRHKRGLEMGFYVT